MMIFNYRKLIDKSVLNILKKILKNSTFKEQGIYISFLTYAKGVVLSEAIRQRFPKEITIILQHQFKDLTVSYKKFVVNISFGRIYERIEVPFDSVTSFLDPASNFAFQFFIDIDSDYQSFQNTIYRGKNNVLPLDIKKEKKHKKKIKKLPKEGLVITFDQFKRKSKERSM